MRSSRRWRSDVLIRCGLAWLLAASIVVFVVGPARAAVIGVNTLADNTIDGDGSCTLREAIANANADADTTDGDCARGNDHDTILFETGPGTIVVNSALLVGSRISIVGPSGHILIDSNGPAIRADGSSANLVLDRIDVASRSQCAIAAIGATVRIERGDLACVDGVAASAGSTVVVESSEITGGPAIDIGGGAGTTTVKVLRSRVHTIDVDVFSAAEVDLEIRDSELFGSVGVDVDAVDDTNVRVRVFDSTVKGLDGLLLGSYLGDSNISARVERSTIESTSKGILVAGVDATAFLTVVDSTIKDSGLYGIRRVSPGSVLVVNSTISNTGDGVDNSDFPGSFDLVHTTITNNRTGIDADTSAQTSIDRSIVAGNTTDCEGQAPTSEGYNIIGVDCGIAEKSTDVIGTGAAPVDPRLEPLADNGGATETHALREDSPAIDLVIGCGPWTDQRGVPRPSGAGCDSGAYEFEDVVAPVLELPDPIVAEATGPSGRSVTYQATASDNIDPDPDVSCSPSSGSTFPIGTTRVRCAATDDSGNTVRGGFDITIQDTTPPLLTVPSDATFEATGPLGAVVVYLATATDIVDPDPVVDCAPVAGSTFPLGTTTVACTATDDFGNVTGASFDITIEDTTPPVLTLLGDSEVEVIEGNPYVDAGATAHDIVDGDLTSAIIVTNPVDTSIPGTYVVRYDVSDAAFNPTTLTRTVVVISQEAAALELADIAADLDTSRATTTSLSELMTRAAQVLGDDSDANDRAAIALVERFIDLVQTQLDNGELTADEAALLTATAQELLSALGG